MRVLAKVVATNVETELIPLCCRGICTALERPCCFARIEGFLHTEVHSLVEERLSCFVRDLETPNACNAEPSLPKLAIIGFCTDDFVVQVPHDTTDGRGINIGQRIISTEA